MKKCSNAQHPHCTYWVMPGAQTCEGGHAQPAPSSFDLLSAMRTARASSAGTASRAESHETVAPLAPQYARPLARPQAARPQLHISGFDPRAAGGRQALKMTLRGMPEGCAPELMLQLQSDLIPHGATQSAFVRASGGEWRPVFAEFSSRGKEHGQYPISIELISRHAGLATRKWVCTFVILVPRPDASLTEIHRIFLTTHKNVRVMADDAAIARVTAPDGHNIDIDVTARNAGIAQIDLASPSGHRDAAEKSGHPGGQVDLGFPTIAWDEELIEVDMPQAAAAHPHPSHAASLVNAAPEAGSQRQVRLFALDECVLGRFELVDPEANLLLTHYTADGQDTNGLTRRLSGRHAVIRRAGGGFAIEDVSRYGILLDGVWPGKHQAVMLRLGMRIELTASIKGIVLLTVSAILPHGVILHRLDHGASAECYYLLMPEAHPGYPLKAFAATPQAASLPILFHRDGGFWHLDQLTGKETALAPGTPLEKLSRMARPCRFASDAYPEHWIIRTQNADQYPTVAAQLLSTA